LDVAQRHIQAAPLKLPNLAVKAEQTLSVICSDVNLAISGYFSQKPEPEWE
jgi:hypothetical protein